MYKSVKSCAPILETVNVCDSIPGVVVWITHWDGSTEIRPVLTTEKLILVVYSLWSLSVISIIISYVPPVDVSGISYVVSNVPLPVIVPSSKSVTLA